MKKIRYVLKIEMDKISDECIFEGVARYNFKNNNYPLLETAKITILRNLGKFGNQKINQQLKVYVLFQNYARDPW